eukprot:14499083-Ditylum_brightwellii.AAC.1
MTVEHALQCKVGGLGCLHHDNVIEEWSNLGKKALVPSAVTREPTIYASGAAQGKGPSNSGSQN